MKLYYLFLLVMFLLMGCGESPQRTREIQPISIHKSDTIKKRSTNLWGTSYKKTSYTPSKKTYKRKSSYKSRTRRHRR